MLTSKEIIERTGISRATLNNYIASGLVPRPQVLPPGPEHGAAPRIGYFPDDTVTRIEAIQRLKREGWSIARIAEHLSATRRSPPPRSRPLPLAASGTAAGIGLAGRAPSAASSRSPAAGCAAVPDHLTLPLALGQPARVPGRRSPGVVWSNEAARTGACRRWPRPAAPRRQRPRRSCSAPAPQGRRRLVRFHLRVARARGRHRGHVVTGLRRRTRPACATCTRAAPRRRPAGAAGQHARRRRHPARTVYAVQFREGVLFAYRRRSRPARSPCPAPRTAASPRRAVTPVAVLVGTLQDAGGLWVKLPRRSISSWSTKCGPNSMRLPPPSRPRRAAGRRGAGLLFRAAGGRQLPLERTGRRAPDARGDAAAVAALAAAQGLGRRAVHERRHRRRPGVDGRRGRAGRENCACSVMQPTTRSTRRASRAGAILVTRNLLGKLGPDQRQHLKYGVPRLASRPRRGPPAVHVCPTRRTSPPPRRGAGPPGRPARRRTPRAALPRPDTLAPAGQAKEKRRNPMRWFNTKDLRSSIYAMFSVSTAAPRAPDDAATHREHPRDDAGPGRRAKTAIAPPRWSRRIRYATDLQALWFMRGELMALLARSHGEVAARRDVEELSAHVRGPAAPRPALAAQPAERDATGRTAPTRPEGLGRRHPACACRRPCVIAEAISAETSLMLPGTISVLFGLRQLAEGVDRALGHLQLHRLLAARLRGSPRRPCGSPRRWPRPRRRSPPPRPAPC